MTTQERLEVVVAAAEDAKAERIETLDLEGKSVLADYFVICSGNSDVHVRAISDRIQEAMQKLRQKGGREEGRAQAVWVLLDFGDVVAHVMRQEQREYYNIEAFWRDAPVLEEMRKPKPQGDQ